MARLKKIKIPSINTDLAYLCGVLAGDGYIGIRKHKHEYVVNCGGNPLDEREFYNSVISPLFKKLFSLEVKPKLLSGNTYGFNVWSKSLVHFLIYEIGMTLSPKNNVRIPLVFKENPSLALSFVRGVADTDFSFQLRKRNYPYICGSSKCKDFIKEITRILQTNQFRVSTRYDYKVTDSRLVKGYNTINVVTLSGHKNFERWINLIGTSQPKNILKIEKWKKYSGGRI